MIYLRLLLLLSIVSVSSTANENVNQSIDSTLFKEGAAMIHVFRGKGNASISYDLQLSNRILCRVKENSKESIKVTKLGNQKIWARIDKATELPINIEAGKHYYIKCGVGKGPYSGYPTLDIKSHPGAGYEFSTFQRTFKEDKILLKDGDIIECFITHEEQNKIHFIMLIGEKQTRTSINKDRVIATKRSENK